MDREVREYEVTVETVEQGELVKVAYYPDPNDRSSNYGYEWIVEKDKVQEAIDKLKGLVDAWADERELAK